MCGPHHCTRRGTSAPGPEILRRLLQLRQNASILEQGCAGFSLGSANRCDQFTRHPWRTSSPLRPRLSFRYTHYRRVIAGICSNSLVRNSENSPRTFVPPIPTKMPTKRTAVLQIPICCRELLRVFSMRRENFPKKIRNRTKDISYFYYSCFRLGAPGRNRTSTPCGTRF
jgi:hypothetical protein